MENQYEPYSSRESMISQYLRFYGQMRTLQGIERFLSMHEQLECEEIPENRNEQLINDLDDWAMYCWSEWKCIEARMAEMREKWHVSMEELQHFLLLQEFEEEGE